MIQQKSHVQQQNESTMVGLIAHEATFSKRLDSAARMAALRCKEDDEENIHWKKVDEMEAQHTETIKNLSTYTQMLQTNTLTVDKLGGGGLDDIVNSKDRTNENKSNNPTQKSASASSNNEHSIVKVSATDVNDSNNHDDHLSDM